MANKRRESKEEGINEQTKEEGKQTKEMKNGPIAKSPLCSAAPSTAAQPSRGEID
jgi:hypothetical protein